MRKPLRAALTAWAVSFGVLAVGGAPTSTAAAESPESAPAPQAAEGRGVPASEAVIQVADWVTASRDSGGLPFVIIDKVSAQVFVFDADAQLKGSAPALLGLARGDDSAPGIGERELSKITPEERTTPAGRFLAGYGEGPDSDILWVDYETAVSMHQVVTTNPKEQRLRRLQTPSPNDNRITFGCINVPIAFYQEVVLPMFKASKGVVYILPETRALDEVFADFRPQARLAGVAGLVVATGLTSDASETTLPAVVAGGDLEHLDAR
ncbi:L,D-transpeptidase [Phenylobacterium sp.]|uniref:L,D-transpeptidase n=1 Tax=Phenylobacterium sp. TaxID=1871053 RepID=UPI00289BF21F|nr:L,D-transpeptidase [Phenylobacterium sp.]